MGVKNLNRLIKKCQPVGYRTYDTIIVDGSNLIYQSVASRLTTFHKNSWNGFDIPLVDQTKTLIKESVNRVLESLLNDSFHAKSVYVVVDPSNMSYAIRKDMLFDGDYADVILNGNDEINLSVKMEEQALRAEKASKQDELLRTTRNIVDYISQRYPDRLETLGNDVCNIYSQSFYYQNADNLGLIRHIVGMISSRNAPENVHFIQAVDEADLVIKNIAAEHPEESILVKSMDTDYYVLFADMNNVDVTDIRSGDVYNPYNCWKEILPADFNAPNVIVRLAPLFGNDYTAHRTIVSAENIDDFFMLFTDNYWKVTTNRRKTLGKMVSRRLSTIYDFDECCKRFDSMFYRNYCLSVTLYLNWREYNRYSLMNDDDDTIFLAYDKLAFRIYSEYTAGSPGYMYEWSWDGRTIESITYKRFPLTCSDDVLAMIYEDIQPSATYSVEISTDMDVEFDENVQ